MHLNNNNNNNDNNTHTHTHTQNALLRVPLQDSYGNALQY